MSAAMAEILYEEYPVDVQFVPPIILIITSPPRVGVVPDTKGVPEIVPIPCIENSSKSKLPLADPASAAFVNVVASPLR